MESLQQEVQLGETVRSSCQGDAEDGFWYEFLLGDLHVLLKHIAVVSKAMHMFTAVEFYFRCKCLS